MAIPRPETHTVIRGVSLTMMILGTALWAVISQNFEHHWLLVGVAASTSFLGFALGMWGDWVRPQRATIHPDRKAGAGAVNFPLT